jgi:hypothetical protein
MVYLLIAIGIFVLAVGLAFINETHDTKSVS